ncbi:MAG: class I SAM-dependent methyltransferase [Flavobacteriaceae bacterium]|nr:class I SAM-dependent methyltransferase [Flavobacteriaceae bacterium]
MQKIHPNQAEAIANALSAILEENKRASRVLENCLEEHPKWGARDRNLLYSAVYGILRWKRNYSFYSQLNENDIPYWSWLKTWCILNDYSIPDWKEMDCAPHQSKAELLALTPPEKAVAHSFPDWLFTLGEKELGKGWEKECNALNQQAGISLRVNRLKASPKKVQTALLEKHQVETVILEKHPDALVLPKGRKLNKNPLFTQGYFEIQDANSQQIAPFCQVEPGMNVIDLCAGAGGKTLHFAALMRNKGALRAYDVEPNKLKELNRRAKRAKLNILEAQLLNDQTPHQENTNWADILLIDAPCSGLGTLKRSPEIKWNLTPENLNELQQTQRDLLYKGANWVKSGGRLIYATCSILPSENEKQIEDFLEKNADFILEEQKTILPSESSFDGFFMARLKKQ